MENAIRSAFADDGTAIVTVLGEIDFTNADEVYQGIRDALAQGEPPALRVDLKDATFIDSTGCRELLRAAKNGRAAGTQVELVAPKENWRIRRVIDFMQFDELLPVHDALPPA